MMELSCENSQWLKIVNYFRQKRFLMDAFQGHICTSVSGPQATYYWYLRCESWPLCSKKQKQKQKKNVDHTAVLKHK